MDDLVSALRKGVADLVQSPVLLLAGMAAGIISVPGLIAYGQFSDIVEVLAANYILIVPLLAMPFILGGSFGYALEVSRTGSSGITTFLNAAKNNYMKLLLAGIVAFILFNFLSFGLLLVAFSAGIAGDAFIALILALISVTIMFLGLMAIEFYDIIIVAEGSGVMQAFTNSVTFVRRNFAPVVSFFIVLILLKFLVQFPVVMVMAAEMAANETYYTNVSYMNATYLGNGAIVMSLPTLITVGLSQVLIQSFVFAFLTLYKTEFYLSVKSRKKITDFDYDFSDEKLVAP